MPESKHGDVEIIYKPIDQLDEAVTVRKRGAYSVEIAYEYEPARE